MTSAVDREVLVSFQTEPPAYRHWSLSTDGQIATLVMDVDEHERSDPGLRAQAELLRPGRRYRAVRRGAAVAVRASRGARPSS